MSWKNIAIGNFAEPTKLEFHQFVKKGDKLIVVPPPEVLDEGKSHFQNCHINYFLTVNMSFYLVRGVIKKLWGKENLLDITATEDSFFLLLLLKYCENGGSYGGRGVGHCRKTYVSTEVAPPYYIRESEDHRCACLGPSL